MKKRSLFIIFTLICCLSNQKTCAQNIPASNALGKIAKLQLVACSNGLKLVPEQVEEINSDWIKIDENKLKSVDYEKLTPTLLASIQELNQKVTRLEGFHQQQAATTTNWGWKYFLEIGFVVIVFSSVFLSKKRKQIDFQKEES
jgi:hypothetical protein